MSDEPIEAQTACSGAPANALESDYDAQAGSWLRQLIRSVVGGELRWPAAPTLAQVCEIADLIYRMRHTYEIRLGKPLDATTLSNWILQSDRKFESVAEAFEAYAGFPVEGLGPVAPGEDSQNATAQG